MESRLTFDEERHEYAVDGVVVPSVTQIIRFLSCDTAAAASPSMRDAAAERGSRIHAACTAYDFDGEDAEIDGDIVGYVRAYATFRRDYCVKGWELFETPCAYGDDFAGTIDRYGIIGGVPTLVDIKTGSRLHMLVHRAQLAAYRQILYSCGYDVDASAILHLKKDGTYVYKVVQIPDSAAIDAFDNCKRIYEYLKGETK